MGNWSYQRVEVDLVTVLYAIRYGQGRMTYAAQDAANLAHQFWDKFPPDIKMQIMRDVSDEFFPESNRRYWTWLTELTEEIA